MWQNEKWAAGVLKTGASKAYSDRGRHGPLLDSGHLISLTLKKLRRLAITLGKLCLYVRLLDNEIHFRPEGFGFKKCQEEFGNPIFMMQ